MVEHARFDVLEMFESAVAAGLQVGMTEAELREEFEAAMASAMDPEFD